MKWLEIGIVNVDYIKKEMLVNLHDGYNKALSKLDMFSHCMLFFLNVIYILDEPTTGLHEDDVKKVIAVLDALKEKGATIIVIEHNMNLIKESDYVIELGPNGGVEGGYIIKSGYQKNN